MEIEEIAEEIEEIEDTREAGETKEVGTNEVLAPNWSDKSVRNQRRVMRARHLARDVPEKYLTETAYVPVVRKQHFLYYTSERVR